MTTATYQDLPCLSCLTRGCTDIVDDDEVTVVICDDCTGGGYLNAAQAERQRASLNGST